MDVGVRVVAVLVVRHVARRDLATGLDEGRRLTETVFVEVAKEGLGSAFVGLTVTVVVQAVTDFRRDGLGPDSAGRPRFEAVGEDEVGKSWQRPTPERAARSHPLG